jgi:hypothetical protein
MKEALAVISRCFEPYQYSFLLDLSKLPAPELVFASYFAWRIRRYFKVKLVSEQLCKVTVHGGS